jgi:hypothetical protein
VGGSFIVPHIPRQTPHLLLSALESSSPRALRARTALLAQGRAQWPSVILRGMSAMTSSPTMPRKIATPISCESGGDWGSKRKWTVGVKWKSHVNLENTTSRSIDWSWDRPGNPEIGGFAVYLSTSKLDAAFEEETTRVPNPDTRSAEFEELHFGVNYYVKVATLRGEGELFAETKSIISDPVHLQCPVGGWCDPREGTKLTEIQAKNGWWKVSTGDDRFKNQQDMFRECPNPDACVGRSNPDLGAEFAIARSNTTSKCDFKYAGALCTSCSPGFAKSSDDVCGECPKKGIFRLYLFIGMLIALAGMVFLIRSTIKAKGKEKAIHSMIFKVVMNHMQVVGMISLFPLRWPSAVRTLFSVTETASASGTSVLSLECETQKWSSFPSPFYFQALCTAFLPLVATFVAFVLWQQVTVDRVVLARFAVEAAVAPRLAVLTLAVRIDHDELDVLVSVALDSNPYHVLLPNGGVEPK